MTPVPVLSRETAGADRGVVLFLGWAIYQIALQIKEMDYLAAAKALGTSDVRIIGFHVAPQCVAAFLILATTHLGVAIIIEAAGLSRCRPYRWLFWHSASLATALEITWTSD